MIILGKILKNTGSHNYPWRYWGWQNRRYEAHWWFVGWSCFSLGFHVDVALPNIELHLPFGFIRIGRRI